MKAWYFLFLLISACSTPPPIAYEPRVIGKNSGGYEENQLAPDIYELRIGEAGYGVAFTEDPEVMVSRRAHELCARSSHGHYKILLSDLQKTHAYMKIQCVRE